MALPVILAAALLVLSVSGLNFLWQSGNGDMMLFFWPVAILAVVLLWMILRSRFSAWVSPRIFLFACVPVFVLVLAAHILIPYSPLAPVTVSAGPAEAREVDLSGDLYGLDGRSVDLADYKNKLIFLNFWATWCGPCRAEMPSMADLHRQLGEEGLLVVAVTDEEPETVRAYLEDEPYPFTVLLDPKGLLFQKLRVRALPTTFVIDSAGKIVLEHEGGYLWNTPKVIEQFRSLLSE